MAQQDGLTRPFERVCRRGGGHPPLPPKKRKRITVVLCPCISQPFLEGRPLELSLKEQRRRLKSLETALDKIVFNETCLTATWPLTEEEELLIAKWREANSA